MNLDISTKTIPQRLLLISTLLILLNSNLILAQEWKSLRSYQKETGNSTLQSGCWLKHDRLKQTEVWERANLFNLQSDSGNLKYKTICQIRDFYRWFDLERQKQGHEILWIGIAALAAEQLSNLDNGFIRFFIVRDKEIVRFANEGSKKVFKFAFPLLNRVYSSHEPIKGTNAENWMREYGMNEQCLILDPLYKNLSVEATKKLERMAKGKGI